MVTLFSFFKKRLRILLNQDFGGDGFLFTLILLSWILPYLTRVKFSTVAEQFHLSEILSRPEPWYYYLLQFWPRFAPWSLFLPFGSTFSFAKKSGPTAMRQLFLLCWIGIILALIFPIHNKTYRYFLPVFPAYSIILGAACKENLLLLASYQKDWLTRSWKYSTRFCFFIFTVFFSTSSVFSLAVYSFFYCYYSKHWCLFGGGSY